MCVCVEVCVCVCVCLNISLSVSVCVLCGMLCVESTLGYNAGEMVLLLAECVGQAV